MANDTTKIVDVKDAVEKVPDIKTSGQVDPKLEKVTAPDLIAKEIQSSADTAENAPGDVVVSFDKINEIVSGKQAAVKEAEQAPPEKQGAEKSGPNHKKAEPEKPGPDKGKENEPKTADSEPKSRQPKTAEKADKKPSHPAKQEKQQKYQKTATKKQSAGIGGGSVSGKSTEQPKQETPPRPLFSRPNRGRPPAPMNRNRLYISVLPNFTHSKVTLSKSAKTRKWRQWWKALRTKA